MTGLIDSIYEHINDDYGYGKIGTIKVVIRRKDGWINGSKLASLKKKKNGDSVPKALHKYKEMDRTQEIIEKLRVLPDGTLNLFEETTKTDLANQDLSKDDMQIIQGTYVPSLIGIDIAVWVSVDLYLKVLKVFEEYNNKESRLLKAMNGELSRENLSLMEKLEVQNKKLDHIINQNDRLLRRSNEIYELVKNDKPPTSECIIIYAHPDNDGKYYIRAGLKASIERRAKKDNGTNVICYENISNAKRALKEAKNIGIIPRNTTTCYNLSEKTYNNINKVLQGVDDKYKKDNEE